VLALAVALLPAAGLGVWLGGRAVHAPVAQSTPTPAPTRALSTPPGAVLPFVPASPRSLVSPTPFVPPARLLSTVPADTRVFYYSRFGTQPGDAVRLEALDWSGAPRGYLDIPGAVLGGPVEPRVMQSPDGQRLLVNDDAYTAQGEHLVHLILDGRRWETLWADDSRHLCTLASSDDATGVSWSALVIAADGHVEHTLPLSHTATGDAGWSLEACAVSADRLMAYATADVTTTGVRVLRISDGATILSQNLCTDAQCSTAPNWTAVTPDARWAAETMPGDRVQLRDLLTGRTTTLPAGGEVVALSLDASRLIVGHRNGADSATVQLVDVQSGGVLWSRQTAAPAAEDVAIAPRGGTLVFAWRPPGATPAPSPGAEATPATLTLLATGNPIRARDLVPSDVYSLWSWKL
jgi:hypothetical protein